MSATNLNDLYSHWVRQVTAISDRTGTRIISETYARKLAKRVTGRAIRTAWKLWELEDD